MIVENIEILVLAGTPERIAPYALAMVSAVACALYVVLKYSAKNLALIQHLNDIWKEFTSKPIATFRHQTAISRLAGLPLEETEFFKVLTFFEGLGLLEKRGYLSATGILEIFGPWIFFYYRELLKYSQDRRKHERYPNLHRLHYLLQTLRLKRNKNWSLTLPTEMGSFWQVEATSTMDYHKPA